MIIALLVIQLIMAVVVIWCTARVVSLSEWQKKYNKRKYGTGIKSKRFDPPTVEQSVLAMEEADNIGAK